MSQIDNNGDQQQYNGQGYKYHEEYMVPSPAMMTAALSIGRIDSVMHLEGINLLFE